jgi:hypothetical protein
MSSTETWQLKLRKRLYLIIPTTALTKALASLYATSITRYVAIFAMVSVMSLFTTLTQDKLLNIPFYMPQPERDIP